MTMLVVCEQRQGELKDVSLEMIAAARKTASEGEKVIALVMGSGVEKVAQFVAAHGPDEVVLVDRSELLYYTYDAYKHVLLNAIREARPEVVLSSYTSQGMDLFPGLAASTGMAMLSDCVNLSKKEGALSATRQLYGGKIEANYSLPLPCIVTVRQGAYTALPPQTPAPVRKEEVDFAGVELRTKVSGYETPPKEDVDIEKAKIVVSVGRGIEKKENLPVFEELVKSIDGAVLAGSRPIIDNGWLPKGRQVGVSGKTVRPKLYVALGISGAIQHLSGMSGSELIVAVNKDRDAPIFKVANIGVVDDIFKFVPALISELKKN